MQSRVVINPRISINVSAEHASMCNRRTCRFTGARHVCDLFQQQLLQADTFDEAGNLLLKRCEACVKAEVRQ